MNQFVGILICCFHLFYASLYAQENFVVEVDWTSNQKMLKDTSLVEVNHFKGAIFDFNQHHCPIYVKRIELPINTEHIDVFVNVLSYEESITPEDLLTDNLNWKIITERKIPVLIIYYVPLHNGKAVKSFDLKLKLSYGDFPATRATQAVNSVLAQGSWFKLSVSEEGLYKLDKEFLLDLGINTDEINPKNIQIYGNGGGMLPEDNSVYRYDDLVQNSIHVVGEDDEQFDDGDFVVFYAQSPHSWDWDESLQRYSHRLNIYEDNNYYFLYIGDEAGKRINSNSELLSSNHTSNTYIDKKKYEWEDQNLVNSGRQWFGEYFSFNEQYSLNFNFSNRVITEPVLINARAVGSSISSSNMYFNHNNTKVLDLSIPALPASSGDLVAASSMSAEFTSQDDIIDLSLSYDKNGNSNAFAYLDYVEIQATCELTYNGGTLLFSDPQSIEPNRVTSYAIQSLQPNLKVWDVTNAVEIKELSVNASNNFVAATDSLKTFAIHNLNTNSYRKPVFIEVVENQNLHAHEPCDLVIITAPEFVTAAERLADFHRSEGIRVNVALTNQIYNEFSSGRQDLVAIRDYLRMLYSKGENDEDIIDDVLLFGDASFDYKGIGELNNRYTDQNFVPTYQSYSSFKIGPSYCTDDFLAVLDDTEGQGDLTSFDGLDVGVGRVVCQTLFEAESYVDKVIHYNSSSSLGDWRSTICFVADDVDEEWEYRLQKNIDEIAHHVDTTYHNYNVKKIYLDAYQQVASAGGQRYPEAREDIIETVDIGALIMHYYGHGGEVGWAEERVLELVDINAWENIDNMPVFITATCEFSRYDDSKRVSAGEQVLLNPNGAGIALFTTTRTITESDAKSLSAAFYDYAIPETAQEHLSFGQIIRRLKNDLPNYNKKKFTLLGDPALKLPIPKLSARVVDIINMSTGNSIDTLNALSHVKVIGFIADEDGLVQENYNGTLYPKVYDKSSTLQTLNNDIENLEPFNFELQYNLLYAGQSTIENGHFEFEYVVPKDIAYHVGMGKMSFYALSDSTDAIGADNNIVIGGYNENAPEDFDGPSVDLYMNDAGFKFGGITDESPSLYAIISDESGINTTGNGIGHNLVATLDQDSQNSIVLNNYYIADLDSYKSGVVSYPFSKLSEGRHELKFKVWDVYNNSTSALTEFLVVSNVELILDNLLNYPNPFTDYTKIYFEYNMSSEPLDALMEIFGMDGALVYANEVQVNEGSYANSDFVWRGVSSQGAPLAAGMYLCKISIKTQVSNQKQTISNQMILIK